MKRFDNKLHQYRNDGLAFAMKIIEKDGVEGLKKEIQNRKAFFVPFDFGREECKVMYSMLAERILATYNSVALFTLHDRWGFGKRRLERFRDDFNEQCDMINDWDKFGERYVTIKDMADELCDKYGIELNNDQINKVDEDCQKEAEAERRVKLDAIIELLKDNQHEKAATFLSEWEKEYYGGTKQIK